MPLLDSLRSLVSGRRARPAPHLAGRRQFFRRATGLGVGVAAGGLLLPDEAWAGVEARADRFGIVPGTVVDARGRPKRQSIYDPTIGEIMMFGGNFAPRSWALCSGGLLPISSYEALFSIIGPTFGGDGRTTFRLPDLRGRSPVGIGTGPGLSEVTWGETGGTETTTLSPDNVPAHTHTIPATTEAGTTDDPTSATLARPASSIPQYVPAPAAGSATAMDATGPAGNGQAFDNRPPYLGIHFIIALEGVFPSRS